MRAGNNFCAVAICVNAELFGAVIKAITNAYNEVSLPARCQLDTCLRLSLSPAWQLLTCGRPAGPHASVPAGERRHPGIV